MGITNGTIKLIAALRVPIKKTQKLADPPVVSEEWKAAAATAEKRKLLEELKLRSQSEGMIFNQRVHRERTRIKKMQEELRDAGFYAGPCDGEGGEATAAALAEFHSDRGLYPR